MVRPYNSHSYVSISFLFVCACVSIKTRQIYGKNIIEKQERVILACQINRSSSRASRSRSDSGHKSNRKLLFQCNLGSLIGHLISNTKKCTILGLLASAALRSQVLPNHCFSKSFTIVGSNKTANKSFYSRYH